MSDISELMKRAEEIRVKYEELNAKRGREAWRIRDYAMGYVGDVGDLMKLVMAKENLRENVEDVDERLAHELADCLYATLVIANYYNIDLEKEFKTTLDRIEARVDGGKK
jgi:NTP pyrophosphatase (non-canonical NTP hydrolase)